MNLLKGLCKNCLGCNRLELEDFKGTYECKLNKPIPPEIQEILNRVRGGKNEKKC